MAPDNARTTWTDPASQMVMTAIAERAAEDGARKAVKQSFFLLGVDLENNDSVEAFRTSMKRMRDDERGTRERNNHFHGGLVSVIVALLVSILTPFVTKALKLS